jgi:hypothetical protein
MKGVGRARIGYVNTISINVEQDSVLNSIGYVMENGIAQMHPMKKL